MIERNNDQQIPKRIPLTPTGLLMEGVYTNYRVNECNGDITPTTFLKCLDLHAFH